MSLVASISVALGAMLVRAYSWARAADFDTTIPMRDGGAATFYVDAHLDGIGDMAFMVDTGSGYLTINEHTLAALETGNHASYLHDLQAVLADGSEVLVPVYRIKSLSIGGRCHLFDVDAAVFPGATRQILGLSALKKAAPFIFSFNPPNLVLSNCPAAEKVAAATDR